MGYSCKSCTLQQGIVIFALKKSTGLCLNQREPHSIRGLKFFATAITKNLNSFKISQLQKLQINTKITPNFLHIYIKIYNTLTPKFSTHLHQNFPHIYTKIFFSIYKTFTYLFNYLFICMVCTIKFSFWYS